MSRFPAEVATERVLARLPVAEDAELVLAAVQESLPELEPYMPWAHGYDLATAQTFIETARANFESDAECSLLFFDHNGRLLGGSGYPRPDWQVPRFEIGYWCRTSAVGHGYVTELSRALTRHAFVELGAVKTELRMDARNERSEAVALRLGYRREAHLKWDERAPDGTLRDTLVYALFDLDELL